MWVVFLAALIPALLWDLWGHPNSFEIADGQLTAKWLWGRQRSWPLQDLSMPDARSWWSTYHSGYAIVRKRQGGWAFIVTPKLSDFEEFAELIEPGSTEARKFKHNPNSWWNRDLFK